MKRTTQDQSQPYDSMTVTHGDSDSSQTIAEKVSNTAHAVREQIEDRGAEMIDQAKQKVSQVYDQANKSLNEQYEKAMGYGRENPGKVTLIAFGVGVGVGLLVAGSFAAPRSRRRMVESVMNTLSTLAYDLFR